MVEQRESAVSRDMLLIPKPAGAKSRWRLLEIIIQFRMVCNMQLDEKKRHSRGKERISASESSIAGACSSSILVNLPDSHA